MFYQFHSVPFLPDTMMLMLMMMMIIMMMLIMWCCWWWLNIDDHDHSTLKSGWRSSRAHEIEKHQRYVTHSDGRRCTNLTLSEAAVNTYGYVRQEFRDFCATIDSKGRGKRLLTLFSLLNVYANAEQVLLAYTPSQSRAQREDVLAAIAAKEAEVAPSQEQPQG